MILNPVAEAAESRHAELDVLCPVTYSPTACQQPDLPMCVRARTARDLHMRDDFAVVTRLVYLALLARMSAGQ
jgi:hypothetical protein